MFEQKSSYELEQHNENLLQTHKNKTKETGNPEWEVYDRDFP